MSINSSKTTWDFSNLFKDISDSTLQKELDKVKKEAEKFVKKYSLKSDYLDNPEKLKRALDDFERFMADFGFGGRSAYYYWLKTQQDLSDPKNLAGYNKVEEFSNSIRNSLEFFRLNLSKIPLKKQNEFLKDPLLREYKHFLEKLFASAKHLLSEKEEKIINLKEPSSHSKWVHMTESFLASEKEEALDENGRKGLKTVPELLSLICDQNKRVRDSAALALNKILEKYTKVAENELNAVLANKKIDDTLRGFDRPDASRHLDDDIDSKTVDVLIESVSLRFDLSERFYKLKARLLKLKKLEYHERNIEYGKLDRKYTFEEGINIVYDVLYKLDPEFSQILKDFVEKGLVDVYPKVSKRDGAFCAYWLKTHPTFTLLNYTGSLRDVVTVAHELGHGINFELTKTQNSLNFGTPLSITEVASNFFQNFVIEELLKDAKEEELLSALMMKLNDDISSIFRQIACYRFEQELHKSFRETGYLSKDDIGKLFQKHMSAYMGKYVLQSEGSENWWVYWGHIRNFFYNYSYANGLLISKALYAKVKEEAGFVSKIKYFLSAGMSDSPSQIFKKIGIDVKDRQFWLTGLQEIERDLKTAEKLAKKLKKI